MAQKFQKGIKVAGRAVEFWGSQSISSEHSAIFELVKNARDADAKKVSITFENLDKEDAKIIIDDDGHGMTLDEIVDKWLVAGTDTKIKNPKSKGGKTVWGEMGIGRFACEKLAKKTTMLSYPEKQKDMVQMSFDWELYKKPGITFDEVEHPGFTDDKDIPSKHGLKLILEDLNSTWNQNKISKLTEELGTFILPPELQGPDDIEIEINAEQFGVKAKQVEGAVTKIAPIKLTADFKDGELLIKISDIEHNQGQWHRFDIDEKFGETKCGPFIFNLYFYPRDIAKKGTGKWESYYEEKLENLDIGDFLNDHAGIYLYRDGAWMKPLGGKNDWLQMEARRVQRRDRIGLTQVYGVIKISQESNQKIRPTAHRETIQDNEAFQDLKKIIMRSITALETYRKEKKGDEPKTSEDIPPENVLAKNNIDILTKTLNENKDHLSEPTFRKFKNGLASTKTYIESIESEMEEEIQKFGELRHHEDTVAAVGLLTSYMAYEIVRPLGENVEVISKARKTMESTDFSKPLSKESIENGWDWLENLENNTQKILHFVSFVRVLSKHIAASVRREGRPSQFDLMEAWDTVADGFKDFTEKLGIDVSENVVKRKIRFSRIDLEAILTNLFLNSINALKNKKEGQRRIQFDANYTKEGLTMKFSDDGKGIPQKHLDQIFDPFYTVAENPEDTAHGHGLGLAIVKKIVDRHGGSITAQSPASPFRGTGATITINIPADKVPIVVSRM